MKTYLLTKNILFLKFHFIPINLFQCYTLGLYENNSVISSSKIKKKLSQITSLQI